ncbi:MAG TPA: hypothetical protein VIY47_17015, partial [Ignavibacteriaceae bacterium]
MTRYQLLMIVFGALLCSCSPVSEKAGETTTKAGPNDSITTIINLSTEKVYAVERAYYDSKDYSLLVKSIYLLTDTLKFDSSYYCSGNFLYVINKATRSVDSIGLAEGCADGVLIRDVTQELRLKTPLFHIASPGGSDTYTNEFIGYKNGSLKKLFEIFDYNPAELERKDEHTLTGFVKDRDEVVSDFQDYPVIVSLDDYSVKTERPARQKIGYSTVALTDFEGYRVNNDLKSRYLV